MAPATGADGCLCPPPSLFVPVHVRVERCRGRRQQGGISVGVAWRIDQASGDRVVISKLIKDTHNYRIDGTNVAAVGNAPGHRAGQVLHRVITAATRGGQGFFWGSGIKGTGDRSA